MYFCLFLLAHLDVDIATIVGFLLSAAMQHGGVFRMGMVGMGMVLIELPD